MKDKQGPTEVVFVSGPECGSKCEACHRLAHINATCGEIKLPCCGQDACKRRLADEARKQHVAYVTRSFMEAPYF